jgi:hypothetical protein
MPAGNTYEAIATTALSGASSVTFSSIPSTYTDLVIVVAGAVNAGAQNFDMRLNSDTGTNYSRTFLSGDGSSAASSRESNYSYITLDRYSYFTTGQSNMIINLLNYSNTTTNKTVLVRGNNAGVGTSAVVGLWRSTTAISTVYMYLSGSTFASGSTASLYGIKAA